MSSPRVCLLHNSSGRLSGNNPSTIAAAMMTTVDSSNPLLLRKSSSAAVVVPSSTSTTNTGNTAMDCSWLSSSAGSAAGGVGFLSSGLMLESSASATEIGSGGGRISSGSVAISSDIRQHLQSMFHVLRPEETLKMVSSGSLYLIAMNVITSNAQ